LITQQQAPRKETLLVVGLGEIQVSNDPDVTLACLGLGSCIGICAYDLVARVGAMAHVVLPVCDDPPGVKAPAKYANHAIPLIISEMEKLGAIRRRMMVKIAGGAKIISTIKAGSILDVGERNIEAVKKELSAHHLLLDAEDVRGSLGRSLWLNIETGVTRVKQAASEIRVLENQHG
jgi:chemotaxis protein CheD